MAITAIDRTVLKLNEAQEIDATSASAVFGADARGGDYKTLFIFENAGGSKATVTIACGDGIQGANAEGSGIFEDLEIEVTAGKTAYLAVDSGYFKNVSGDYKDYIKVTPSASLNVTVVELPQ